MGAQREALPGQRVDGVHGHPGLDRRRAPRAPRPAAAAARAIAVIRAEARFATGRLVVETRLAGPELVAKADVPAIAAFM